MRKTAAFFLFFMGFACLFSQDNETLFTGDLNEIKKRGELRVLMTDTPELDGIPRRVSPRDYDKVFLFDIAESLNVTLKVVYVETFAEIFPALLNGKGDIIADNLGVNDERKKILSYTVPLCSIQDQLICPKKDTRIKTKADLDGAGIFFEADTAYINSINDLKKEIPSVKAFKAPPGVDTESLIFKVSAGEVPLAIADTNYVGAYLSYRDDIRVVYTFPKKEHTAWAVRKNNPALLKYLNSYLEKSLANYGNPVFKGDLQEMKKRKILRVLTRNNPSCYYIHKGSPVGFEYELARKFAQENKLHLIMIVPPKWSDLIPWLIEGKGDIVAALVSKNPERAKIKEIDFCEPYCRNHDRIVGRASEAPFKSVSELKGRTIAARKNSSYWTTLSEMRKSGLDFKLEAVPETLETFEIIDKVAKGVYDLAISDEHIYKLEKMRRNDIKALYVFEKEERHHWLVRRDDKQLKKAIGNFFTREYRQCFFNVVYNRYFKNSKQACAHTETYIPEMRISKYDKLIKKYSYTYGFHWLLICSQIYQESHFDHSLESCAGTIGLMQIKPSTAKDIGFDNIKNPENNIHAGIKYLHGMRKRSPETLSDTEKIHFALASYNAGLGHVIDARRLAQEINLDPNRWFNNVEAAMLLLSKPAYAERAKYGYCRGDEPVNYVRQIIHRYDAYKQEELNKVLDFPSLLSNDKFKQTNTQ